MAIPSSEEILSLLDRLDTCTADEFESQNLDFKLWSNSKQDFKEAVETAVCFANAEGGVIVFGVSDKTKGKASAIHGIQGHDLDRWQHDIYHNTNPHLAVEVEELSVPEGTGTLLLVRVPKPKDQTVAFGTAKGLYKIRIGKSCMPLDPVRFSQTRISTGAVDWSGESAVGVGRDDLDPLEIARARSVLSSKNPDSDLLRLSDEEFLEGLEGLRGGRVTNTGLILFGRPVVLARLCPQSQMHYVHQVSDTKIARNDILRSGLLNMLDFIERLFSGPTNPEEELSLGLFKLRIPAFPLGVVREAVLNAVTHRDYADSGEILIRHTPQELVITNPGGFIGGITIDNLLHHEPAY